MEAALRTVYELVTGRELPFENLHVTPIVGLEQVKEGTVLIENTLPEYSFLEGVEVKVAVTSGLAGAKKLMEQVKAGTSPYHFIEVMGCPGGCITGGGQPRSDDPDVRAKRMKGLYDEDESKPLRKSHENPSITELYSDFLKTPNGHLSHILLHTEYTPRGINNEFTDETYVIEQKKTAKKRVKTVSDIERESIAKRLKAKDNESSKVMALEAENAKLKKTLDESNETIEVFRKIIINSNK